ncbi:GAF domain-containing protein [Nocardia sp. NPDC050697]|uniref:GAF domain-containing protein n=1 Tax=Nocardia sp. NPDC050697 TaxID=3155158 RepID=UPI0034057C8D
MAAPKWLLIETFGERPEPSVIAVGRSPKRFVPLENIVHHRTTLAETKRAITAVTVEHTTIDQVSGDRSRRTIAVPLAISASRLHGLMVWSGSPDEVVPPRDPAGAWLFDLTEDTSLRSDDLLTVYGIPPEQHPEQRIQSIAGVYSAPLISNHRDEGTALARIVRPEDGQETQSLWTLTSPDGQLRALHYSCRQMSETGPDGIVHHLVRGITHDIGPATGNPVAPPSNTLDDRVMDSIADDGAYRAIVNPTTLRLLRWVGPSLPRLAWQALPGQPLPAVHPDDIAAARALLDSAQREQSTGHIRMRALDGAWLRLEVRAKPIDLDPSTTAALVTLRPTSDSGSPQSPADQRD